MNATYGVERMESVAFPSGQTVSYDWGTNVEDFRLKEIEHLGPGTTALLKFGYVTDAISRISQWKKQRGTEPMERFELGYNRSDELTSAVLRDDSTNAILKQYFYSYDPAANRTSEQIDTAVTSGTYNALNQLTDVSAGGKTRFQGTLNEPGTVTVGGQPAWMQGGTNFVADVGLTSGTNSIAVVAKDANNNTQTNTYQVIVPGGTGKSLSYDLAGNTISDGTHTFTWDAASRLVKITYGDNATSEFGYDAFGRRVKIVEKDSTGNATSTKQFVFDGLEIAEQRDGNNVLTTRYFQDGFVTGANATPYEAEQFYYLRDHLGSVRGVFNRDEQAIEVYQDFDPYGRMTLTDGTNNIAADMSYTGHYRHSKSGMYLTMYRAHSPEIGRWLSRDPIGEMGGINLYGYVLNNPINFVDENGDIAVWGAALGMTLSIGTQMVQHGAMAHMMNGDWGGALSTIQCVNPWTVAIDTAMGAAGMSGASNAIQAIKAARAARAVSEVTQTAQAGSIVGATVTVMVAKQVGQKASRHAIIASGKGVGAVSLGLIKPHVPNPNSECE